MHQVSGSISLPSRGSFRLSLTVLVHYRSMMSISLEDGPPHIQTGLHVSRPTVTSLVPRIRFRIQGYHLL